MAKLQEGQSVKYKTTESASGKAREWHNGYFVRQDVNNHVLVARYQGDREPIKLPSRAVKPYERIEDDEQLIQFGKDNIAALEALVRTALKAILPQLDNDKDVKRDTNEPHLILLNGALTVEPSGIDVESIGGFKEEMGWSVTAWHEIPATRLDPPDVSDSLVGNARMLHHAASLAVDAMYKCLADGFWTCYGEEEMYRQWQEVERLAQCLPEEE